MKLLFFWLGIYFKVVLICDQMWIWITSVQLGFDFGIQATGSLFDVAPEYRSYFVFGKKNEWVRYAFYLIPSDHNNAQTTF